MNNLKKGEKILLQRWMKFLKDIYPSIKKVCLKQTKALSQNSPNQMSLVPKHLANADEGKGVRSIEATSDELGGLMRSPYHSDVEIKISSGAKPEWSEA